jgi:hypothetical protein
MNPIECVFLLNRSEFREEGDQRSCVIAIRDRSAATLSS